MTALDWGTLCISKRPHPRPLAVGVGIVAGQSIDTNSFFLHLRQPFQTTSIFAEPTIKTVVFFYFALLKKVKISASPLC